MTDVFAAPFVLAPLAPLAPASQSSGSGFAPSPVGSDWSEKRRDNEANVRKERRGAVSRARAKVEKDWDRPTQTKSQRLAQAASKGTRDTGGLAERRATLSSVQKAVAALADVPMDSDISDEGFRHIREVLRQRYPGAKLSDMLKEGARLEQMLLDDPVNAHQVLLAAYSRAKAAPGYVEPEHAHGVRGSVRRAQQDQEDAEDLKDWIAKYGRRLPQILVELEYVDRSLRSNPNYEAAKLAARHGAPAIDAEIPAYEARMVEKQAQREYDQRAHRMHQGICLAIEAGHIPGDTETLNEMAAVLALPAFKHSQNGLETLKRAAAIALHPEHRRITPGKTPHKAGNRYWAPGQRSISGGPNTAHDSTRSSMRPAPSGVRASIDRAMGQ
jgi:hypothetical protein